MIHVVVFGKRQPRIGTVHRAGRSKYEVSDLALAATLKNVAEPYQVGVNIRIRVLDRIAHARLRRQVHDGVEAITTK